MQKRNNPMTFKLVSGLMSNKDEDDGDHEEMKADDDDDNDNDDGGDMK